ncbi:DUF4153 domain-containing protein [Halomonas citrativorans]|uniref:DUF4153 domain-containing protein n=1 Tax=Halomonas citrativorans TaxID=2742612 RepID=A0ABR9FFB9_9GAMM|nr:DUF4153 domain-containing protein [Halomonas citrativorans]MBE0405197.1 DUF4153 domain-containing protein [Halomonas citrativorans]
MDDHRANTLDKPTRAGLILLAVVQGIALLALHLAIEHEHWLAADQRWLKALYTVAIALPAFYLIGMERLRDRLNFLPLLLAPLLFWLGWHLGWVEQTPEPLAWARHPFTFAFCISLGVALFILALFFRSGATSRTWPTAYSPLLNYSWEFTQTLSQLTLFIGVFWGLLLLGATLFSAIGVSFFETLFSEPVFIYPVTWLVIGLTLVMIRNRFRLIQSVRQMSEALIKALLPLVALIILLFFAMLLFTGVQPVWNTGRASCILMALMLTLLLFFNAVFHQAHGLPPYPTWLRRIILLAVVLLPVGSVLAAWALWLRIDQYGLSLDRLWAALLQVLTAAFTVSYSLLLLWRRQAALPSLQRANVGLALLVALVLIVVNTPLADMRHWVAEQQIKRLLDGRTTAETFDVNYLRYQLGQPGILALQALVESEFAQSQPELARRIELSLRQTERWSQEPLVDTQNLDDVAQQFRASPNGATLPEPLLNLLVEQNSACLSQTEPCQTLQISSGTPFQWLVYEPYSAVGKAYGEHDGDWLLLGHLMLLGTTQPQDDLTCQTTLTTNDLERLTGPADIYRNGNCLYHLQPTIENARQQLFMQPDESRQAQRD